MPLWLLYSSCKFQVALSPVRRLYRPLYLRQHSCSWLVSSESEPQVFEGLLKFTDLPLFDTMNPYGGVEA